MRAGHYLRGNKNTEIPSEAIFFDTETKPARINDNTEEHRLWFGFAAHIRARTKGAWGKPDWLRFETRTEFWQWVDSFRRPKAKIFCFCHNTNFDLPVLDIFGELPGLGWTLQRAVIDAPPTILTFRADRTTLVFLDTLNFFRMPLKKLGEMIGSAKLDMPAPDAPRAEWDRYARQDVQVLIDAMIKWWSFLADNDLGGFASTLAGQALRTYRHRFMPPRLLIDDNEPALALARRAYVGGRCECFHIGEVEGPLYYLDVTSMYPSVMKGNPYPARLYGFTDIFASQMVRRMVDTHAVIAEVHIRTDRPLYPLVVDGRLCFPVGNFDATLAGPELTLALERQHVVEIKSAAFYEPEPLFDGFVDFFWGQRLAAIEAGNAPRAWMFKILMNSLYGKFGQRGLVWEEQDWIADLSAKVWTEIDAQTGAITRLRQLGGLVQAQSQESEARDSSPAIAAYVTSYARLALLRFIELAGWDNVYYCDTDSIIVNDAGFLRAAPAIEDRRLGWLKCEAIYQSAHFFGPKDYRLGEITKTKGIRASAQPIGPSRYLDTRWTSLRGLVRQGAVEAPSTTTVVKTLARSYAKGDVDPDGKVTPLLLPRW